MAPKKRRVAAIEELDDDVQIDDVAPESMKSPSYIRLQRAEKSSERKNDPFGVDPVRPEPSKSSDQGYHTESSSIKRDTKEDIPMASESGIHRNKQRPSSIIGDQLEAQQSKRLGGMVNKTFTAKIKGDAQLAVAAEESGKNSEIRKKKIQVLHQVLRSYGGDVSQQFLSEVSAISQTKNARTKVANGIFNVSNEGNGSIPKEGIKSLTKLMKKLETAKHAKAKEASSLLQQRNAEGRLGTDGTYTHPKFDANLVFANNAAMLLHKLKSNPAMAEKVRGFIQTSRLLQQPSEEEQKGQRETEEQQQGEEQDVEMEVQQLSSAEASSNNPGLTVRRALLSAIHHANDEQFEISTARPSDAKNADAKDSGPKRVVRLDAQVYEKLMHPSSILEAGKVKNVAQKLVKLFDDGMLDGTGISHLEDALDSTKCINGEISTFGKIVADCMKPQQPAENSFKPPPMQDLWRLYGSAGPWTVTFRDDLLSGALSIGPYTPEVQWVVDITTGVTNPESGLETPRFLAVSPTMSVLAFPSSINIYHTETGVVLLPGLKLPGGGGEVVSVAASTQKFMVLSSTGYLSCWNYNGIAGSGLYSGTRLSGSEPISLHFRERIAHHGRIHKLGFKGTDCVPYFEVKEEVPETLTARGKMRAMANSGFRAVHYVWQDRMQSFQVLIPSEPTVNTFFQYVTLGDKEAANRALVSFIERCHHEGRAGAIKFASFCEFFRGDFLSDVPEDKGDVQEWSDHYFESLRIPGMSKQNLADKYEDYLYDFCSDDEDHPQDVTDAGAAGSGPICSDSKSAAGKPEAKQSGGATGSDDAKVSSAIRSDATDPRSKLKTCRYSMQYKDKFNSSIGYWEKANVPPGWTTINPNKEAGVVKPYLIRKVEQVYLQSSVAFLRHYILVKADAYRGFLQEVCAAERLKAQRADQKAGRNLGKVIRDPTLRQAIYGNVIPVWVPEELDGEDSQSEEEPEWRY